MPAARSSAAAAHTSGWQLSASSWMSSRLRGPASRGQRLGGLAQRQGERPRAARGQLLERQHEALDVERLRRAHHLDVAAVAAAVAEGGEADAGLRRDTLPGPRAGPRGPAASLFCRVPSMVPHMEPDPSTMTMRDGGSAAWASAMAAAPNRQGNGQPRCQTSDSVSASAHLPSRARRTGCHCTREQLGLARVELEAIPSASMGQETLDLLLTRRSVKPAMLTEPGPTSQPARDNSDRCGARAGPQEAGALALHRVRGRGAGRLRPRAAQGLRGGGEGGRHRPRGWSSSAPGCCGRRPSSP